MGPEGLLSSSQQPAIYPCTKPDKRSPHHPILFFKLHFNIILPATPIRIFKWSVSFTFPHQNPVAFPFSPIRATFTACLIFLHLITPVIFGEDQKSWSSSLCSLLYHPVTSSHSGPNIILSTPSSNTTNTISLCTFLHVKQQARLHISYLNLYAVTEHRERRFWTKL